jgi:hypothetical protein
MYVYEVASVNPPLTVSQGFKSYGERTVIDGWFVKSCPPSLHTTHTHRDPSFNAIYGNNGHGKSNVLDAICFVLGMTRTGLMRGKQITVSQRTIRCTVMLTVLFRTSSTIKGRPESRKPPLQSSSITETNQEAHLLTLTSTRSL